MALTSVAIMLLRVQMAAIHHILLASTGRTVYNMRMVADGACLRVGTEVRGKERHTE